MKNRENGQPEKIFIADDPELTRDINNILNYKIAKTEEYNFGQFYQTDEIKRDKEKCQGEAGAEIKKITYVLSVGAGACDWLGPEMALACPSDYDAEHQKINLLAECAVLPENPDDEPLVLAISAVAGEKPETPARLACGEAVAGGKNTKKIPVKYFQSPIYSTQCILESAIPITVAVKKEQIDELENLLKEMQKLGVNIRDTGFNNETRTQQLREMVNKFKDHPAQVEILTQISEQLEFLIAQLDEKTKNGAKLIGRLKTVNNVINQTLETKLPTETI